MAVFFSIAMCLVKLFEHMLFRFYPGFYYIQCIYSAFLPACILSRSVVRLYEISRTYLCLQLRSALYT